MSTIRSLQSAVTVVAAALMFATACQPTVQLAAPEEPIVIDININIEQNVRVRIDREIDDLLRENEDLF